MRQSYRCAVTDRSDGSRLAKATAIVAGTSTALAELNATGEVSASRSRSSRTRADGRGLACVTPINPAFARQLAAADGVPTIQ